MPKRKSNRKPWHFIKARIVDDGRVEMISGEGDVFQAEIYRDTGEVIVSRRLRWLEIREHLEMREHKEPEPPARPLKLTVVS